MSKDIPCLKNYMKDMVLDQLDEILEDINMCKCDQCLADVAALALNDLPAKYIVSEKGELYSKINTLKQQFEVDLIAAITKAAVIVKKKPRHK